MIGYRVLISGMFILGGGILQSSHAEFELQVCNNKNATAHLYDDTGSLSGNGNGGSKIDNSVYECADTHYLCGEWAKAGECEANDRYMLEACPCSCHSCPTFIENEWDDEPQMAFGPLREEIMYVIEQTEEYMEKHGTIICRNKYKGCSHWSLFGAYELFTLWKMRDRQ